MTQASTRENIDSIEEPEIPGNLSLLQYLDNLIRYKSQVLLSEELSEKTIPPFLEEEELTGVVEAFLDRLFETIRERRFSGDMVLSVEKGKKKNTTKFTVYGSERNQPKKNLLTCQVIKITVPDPLVEIRYVGAVRFTAKHLTGMTFADPGNIMQYIGFRLVSQIEASESP